MEDPDANAPSPFVHWSIWGIPAEVTTIDEGLPPQPRVARLGEAVQGTNDRGSIGYFGPRPPVGDDAHRYHFQVFALDKVPELPPGATREDVLAELDGAILAAGSAVGTFERR